MNYIFNTGLFGSLILILGAAWPEPHTVIRPIIPYKNWLLAIGGVVMFIYAILNYVHGGPIFFVILQILVLISSLLMMFNSSDKTDSIVLGVSALGLVVWSVLLFNGYNTIIFILGLAGIGLGYAFEMKSLRRVLAITLGSALIALFSYLEANWIFFWLNLFFTIISVWYVGKMVGEMGNKKVLK
ncbi:MAG: hypothetical protein WCJ59_03045 [bacterium]